MTVIAMTRELGSLGKDVAAELAKQLNLQVIHHELVEQEIAERTHLRPSEVHNYLEGSPSLFERWKIDTKKLSRYTADEILQLAKRRNVIIRGWGAVFLLKPISHVLRVRVCAPINFRVKVIKERLGIDNDELAQREIKKNDAAHTRTIQNFTDGAWEDPLNYDVVLNTQRTPIQDCVTILGQLTKSVAFQETDASLMALSDRIIEAKVREALNSIYQGVHSRNILPRNVYNGKVILTGTSPAKSIIKEAIDTAAQIEGVTEVESEIIETSAIIGNV